MKKMPTHVFKVPFWGPFWKMGDLPIGLEWTNFFFFTFSYTKSELKGGGVPLHKKITNSWIWGPTMRGRFGQIRVLANRPKFKQFWILWTFPYKKIKIQRGYILWKKLPSNIIRAPCGGPFWSNAWLPTSQIWANQIFLII